MKTTYDIVNKVFLEYYDKFFKITEFYFCILIQSRKCNITIKVMSFI